MARTATNTPHQQELAAIENDTRFFMRLLIGAGLAAALLVACGVVWHESGLRGESPAITHIQTRTAE